MAGGPSAPGLVIAAARSGALGFLAGGYKTADAMRAEITAVRSAGVTAFGVNVFVPGAPASDRAAVSAYVESLRDDARRVGAEPGSPSWDDDHWADKAGVLLASLPPVVSFTFGCPAAGLIRDLQDGGTLVAVTVTTSTRQQAQRVRALTRCAFRVPRRARTAARSPIPAAAAGRPAGPGQRPGSGGQRGRAADGQDQRC